MDGSRKCDGRTAKGRYGKGKPMEVVKEGRVVVGVDGRKGRKEGRKGKKERKGRKGRASSTIYQNSHLKAITPVPTNCAIAVAYL